MATHGVLRFVRRDGTVLVVIHFGGDACNVARLQCTRVARAERPHVASDRAAAVLAGWGTTIASAIASIHGQFLAFGRGNALSFPTLVANTIATICSQPVDNKRIFSLDVGHSCFTDPDIDFVYSVLDHADGLKMSVAEKEVPTVIDCHRSSALLCCAAAALLLGLRCHRSTAPLPLPTLVNAADTLLPPPLPIRACTASPTRILRTFPIPHTTSLTSTAR